jgi:hypothetical protein
MRCSKRTTLEIHHKRRDGGNGLDNAEVLCHGCHVNTSSFGTPGTSPQPFSDATKEAALKRAGNQCECTKSSGCH